MQKKNCTKLKDTGEYIMNEEMFYTNLKKPSHANDSESMNDDLII